MSISRRSILIAGSFAAAACVGVPEASRSRRGLWRGRTGDVAIGKFPEFGPADFAFDYGAQRVGPLSDGGNGGSLHMASMLNGGGDSIAELLQRGANLHIGERSFRRVAVERVPFAAGSGDVLLSAEFARAGAARRRGAVLMIYGSGPAPKEAFDLWAFWFLAPGFSVITYDKRGSGASGGDWRRSGLEALAADALGVVDSARSMFGRETEPLLAWGASQAGWILPQLGADGVLDGIIMHAGSAMTPANQIIAAVDAELRAYGFGEAEIERAKAYYDLDTEVSRGARGWQEIAAAYDTALAAGAEWLLAPPAAEGAPERTMIRLMADFDPTPYWRRNKARTLAIFGGKDVIVPAAKNQRMFAATIGGSDGFDWVVLPEANHLMFVAETGVRAEYATRSSLHPGYFPAIAAWLAKQT